jgi:hypothetical protein
MTFHAGMVTKLTQENTNRIVCPTDVQHVLPFTSIPTVELRWSSRARASEGQEAHVLVLAELRPVPLRPPSVQPRVWVAELCHQQSMQARLCCCYVRRLVTHGSPLVPSSCCCFSCCAAASRLCLCSFCIGHPLRWQRRWWRWSATGQVLDLTIIVKVEPQW